MSFKHFYIVIALLFTIACNSANDEIAQKEAAAQKSGTAIKPDGSAVFRQNCITCHGANGALGLNGAHDLSKSILLVEERVKIITNGRNLMTPFGKVLSAAQIQAVAEYTLTLKK